MIGIDIDHWLASSDACHFHSSLSGWCSVFLFPAQFQFHPFYCLLTGDSYHNSNAPGLALPSLQYSNFGSIFM
jgi:hypothetical protein